jgi:CheY-like chemotaxis protein
MLLKLLGHEIRIEYDGTAAVQAATEFLPDVALVDIGLPKMNGYDVARQIREHPKLRNILLVAQTGWGQDEHRRRSQEAGFDHHLVKPVALETLQEILKTPRK